jgi:UDP-N-acetylmuramate: L-alanyl-gamma-D-glutamyl-meso-diaminopimelate ligase
MTAFPFRKAHFIGLAGVGMSATAILLRDSGVAVTGSDEAIYPPISQVLAREAFACQAPYAAQNIPDDADLIVIGKKTRGWFRARMVGGGFQARREARRAKNSVLR